jgi:molecular chaperone DnaK (HSP70)
VPPVDAGQIKLELPIRGVGLWTTTLTRDAFEEMISSQLEWLASPCSKCLRGAGLSRKGVDSVLAVGGATRAPIVLKALGEAMGQELTFAVNPDEGACLGAAISAAIYAGKLLDRVVLDVTHHSLGIDYPPGSVAPILLRNSKLPAKVSRLSMTTELRFPLDVLEGEREESSADHSLGKLVWDLPFRKEETLVEVTLTVDITGALEVTAVDGASRTERKTPVSNEPSLKESAMKRYRSEAESYFETYYSRRSNGKLPRRYHSTKRWSPRAEAVVKLASRSFSMTTKPSEPPCSQVPR